MNPQPKQAIIATPTEWRHLREQCINRDGKCMLGCGEIRRERLLAHHLIPRGRVHIDALWNLLTLCYPCHRALHDGRLDVSVDDLINRYVKEITE